MVKGEADVDHDPAQRAVSVSTGRLSGETAIVTGATSGLGVAIAARFVREGAQVVVTGRDHKRGMQAADVTGAAFVPAELTNEASCRNLIESAVELLGTLTVLVNNARSQRSGYISGAGARAIQADLDGPVTGVSWETWQEVLAVGAIAPGVLSGLAIPHMQAAGHGSIVNISSRAAARGTPGYAAYAASKGALEALGRSITADFARSGVRCNTVRPGYVRHTARDAQLSAEAMHSIEEMHLTRVPNAEDVVNAVLFFASSESEVISGTTLPVDGGSSAVRGRTLG